MEKQIPAQVYGKRLSYERRLRGWTRDKLAEMLGVYKTYIGRWERGETLPALLYQQRLGELFGKTAQELGFRSGVSSRMSLTPANPVRNTTELFRRQLRHERELRGWSQADLAHALGVP